MKMFTTVRKLVWLWLLSGATFNTAYAVTIGDVQVHGFASQSFLLSNKNKFFGSSDDGSFEFYELGVNAFWEVSPKLRFAGQVLVRDAGASDNGKDRIDYAFAEYVFLDNESASAGVRVGRVINPLGFFNATRDVAGTRPSILLPQSVYSDNNRNFSISADGVQVYIVKTIANGELMFEAERARPRTRDPDLEVTVLGDVRPGSLEGRDDSWLAKLNYDYDFGRWRFALTHGKINVDYDPAVTDRLQAGVFDFKPTLLSVQHQQERWGITAEFLRRSSTLSGFGFPEISVDGDNFFVQGDYRVNDLNFFLRYDHTVRNNDDRRGKQYEAATGRPAYTRYAKDWTVGGRWDINQNLSLNAEWHMVEGAAWLSMIENNGIPRHKYWNMLMMSVSLKF